MIITLLITCSLAKVYEVKLLNHKGVQMKAEMMIGTPKQGTGLMVDTGSSLLWVMDNNNRATYGGDPISHWFHKEKSHSFKQLNET